MKIRCSQGEHRRSVSAGAVALLVGVLAGCSEADSATTAAAETPVAAGEMPSAHIHGVAIDPSDGTHLLATHDGLFEVAENGLSTRVGPVIDLMGFTVAGPGHFLSSGHPGPGVDLPQPVGLIESTDGGRTWVPLSRQGVSDFHALAVSDAGVLGFDGSLWRSGDREEWEQVTIPVAPAALAASPDGTVVIATTQDGLLRSDDAGSSWSPIGGAPLLQIVDWAPDGAGLIGVTPSGTVWMSADRGTTWQQGTDLGSAPQAIDASGTGVTTRIAVVTVDGLFESRDNGQTFTVVLES